MLGVGPSLLLRLSSGAISQSVMGSGCGLSGSPDELFFRGLPQPDELSSDHTHTLEFVIPSEVEGSAVPASGRMFPPRTNRRSLGFASLRSG